MSLRGPSTDVRPRSGEAGDVPSAALEAARRMWGLLPRQLRVLELLLTGASNKEIACALQCAEVTVENHLTALYRRAGACSRTDLVCRVFARTASLGAPDDGA